jgi:hypothetical protein
VIVEQRIYTTQIGKVNTYRDYYAEHGLPVQKRILGNLLGFFTSDIGELNQVVQLWGYDTYAERERRRAILAQDADWLAYLKGAPQVIVRQENRILIPAAFSPIN